MAKYARRRGESTIFGVPRGHLEAILKLLRVHLEAFVGVWRAILKILTNKGKGDKQTIARVGDLETHLARKRVHEGFGAPARGVGEG